MAKKPAPTTTKPKIIHEQQSPFPFTTPKGAIIINELCRCGEMRTEHYDTVAFGHGPSPAGCDRFTWVAHVFMMPNGEHVRLDGRRSVTFKLQRRHDLGGAGWAYQVWTLDDGAVPRRLFNTVAKVLGRDQALAHAREELKAYDERQRSK